MKFQIKKKKKNGRIVELLIPTFKKKKKFFSWEDKTFLGLKNYGKVVLTWSTND